MTDDLLGGPIEGAATEPPATPTPTQPSPTTAVADPPASPSEASPPSVAGDESAASDGGETPPPSAAEAAASDERAEPAGGAAGPSAAEPERPEPATMEELLAEEEAEIRALRHGDVVEGTVVRIDRDEILVDIGAKSEGVVSNRELYGRHADGQPQLNVGDTVLVYVLQPESPEGHAVLSLRRAGLERKWRAMQELYEAGTIIEAPVIDHNKGGLIVDCGIRGFVPISQIVDFPRRPQNDQPRDAAQEIAEKLQPYVGRKLRLKILEVNRKANRLILSEKVALYEERKEKREELFSSLQVGQRVSGTVRSIAPFGVFVDLGGIDGLVHKTELSWNKVNNPEAGYRVGDRVEAEVIDINHERGRISLSIRRLQPDPWQSAVADLKVGDIVEGTVTKLVNFGAFVRVRDGLEGLIHISELSHQRVSHPGEVVHEGQQLRMKVVSLDSERHRLGLSLKQAEEAPPRPAPPPRSERRRERGRDRGWSPSDAVQEPEGGIDNTLAAAFAQVREQVAAAEAAAATETGSETGPSAPVSEEAAEAEGTAEAMTAEATTAVAVVAEEVTEPAADAGEPVGEATPAEGDASTVAAPVEAEAVATGTSPVVEAVEAAADVGPEASGEAETLATPEAASPANEGSDDARSGEDLTEAGRGDASTG